MKLSKPETRAYASPANETILGYVTNSDQSVLDVGCGTGELAKEIRRRFPYLGIDGITNSKMEHELSTGELRNCYLYDLNDETMPPLQKYDLIIFSHVLEHLPWPRDILKKFANHLNRCGRIIVIVPNLMYWRTRLQIIKGHFEYTETGVLDVTHLRFFSYYSVKNIIPSNLKIMKIYVDGHFPLGKLRKIFGYSLVNLLDNMVITKFPNIFGTQINLLLDRIDDSL